MKSEVREKVVGKLKNIFEQVEIYQGSYAELDTKENGIVRAIGRLERPRVSDVARELGISMSTASWCIDRLEQKKYLVRRRGETDRRAVFLTLTKKGKAVVQQFDDLFDRLVSAAAEKLTEQELEAFADMLGRIEISRN
jgi:DNA-binding MarR family transcriptional regulator